MSTEKEKIDYEANIGSIVQVCSVDIESNDEERLGSRRRLVRRVWRAIIPTRQTIVQFTLGVLVAILIAICIFQSIWIHTLSITSAYHKPIDEFEDAIYTHVANDSRVDPWTPARQSYLHSAIPVPVHSHNDYQRRVPVFEALSSGCISLEADVHLRNNDLLVGHQTTDLKPGLTLRAMYLDPLKRILDSVNNSTTNSSNGIYTVDPQQTLVLLVDHKTSGPETLAELYTQLQDLRDSGYLSYWNGTDRVLRPLTVVATGNAPFDLVAANRTYRDIFWDAKLSHLSDPSDGIGTISDNSSSSGNSALAYKYNYSNSWYASTSMKQALGKLTHNKISTSQMSVLTTQIREAKQRGLVSRYWNTPAGPPLFRDYVWDTLVRLEVGVLNADDLRAVRARGWGRWPFDKVDGGM